MKKKDRISIANILALVACAFLLLFTFSGQLLLRKGDLTSTLLIVLGVGACFMSLLVALIKVKQVEKDFKRWRYVEYSLLVVYCVAMYFLSSGTIHFLSLDEDDLEQTAKTDIENIRSMLQTYEIFEGDALNSTVEGLRNACRSEMISDNLESFMRTNSIACTESGIDGYKNDMEEVTLGESPITLASGEHIAYKMFKAELEATLDSISNKVGVWNTYALMDIAKVDTITANDVSSVLTQLSMKNAKLLPKIAMNANGYYAIVQPEQSVEIGVPVQNLYNVLCRKSSGTFFSWLLYVLIHAAILLNYLVVNRSTTLEIKRISLGGGKL